MGPISAVSSGFAKIFNFSGRASRSEYWWFFLLGFIVSTITILVDAKTILALMVANEGAFDIYQLSVLELATPWACLVFAIPMISLSVRRLHDAGFSGFWFLVNFIPLGGLALSILYMLPSQNTTTHYGAPAVAPIKDSSGKPVTVDAHKRAMQGYAVLFDKDKPVSAEVQAARKAEISDYYRTKVLKPAASV